MTNMKSTVVTLVILMGLVFSLFAWLGVLMSCSSTVPELNSMRGKMEIPLIDEAAKAKLETATFALG